MRLHDETLRQKGSRMREKLRGDVKRLNVDIPAQLHSSLKIMAVAEGISMQKLVMQVLEDLAQQPIMVPPPIASHGPRE